MSGRTGWALVVTAEHGGNDVPRDYRPLFRGHTRLLASHRGWDAGTLHLAAELGRLLDAPLVTASVTRLLVDLNRSPHNPRVFSPITRTLPHAERHGLLERFHAPHWSAVRREVARGLAGAGRVLHLGVHSFAPVLDGSHRKAELALLYDPARPAERALAIAWIRGLRAEMPERVLRRNDPYRGKNDGLTTALRREHPDNRYLGIEIEVNQKLLGRDGRFPAWVAESLARTVAAALPGSARRAAGRRS